MLAQNMKKGLVAAVFLFGVSSCFRSNPMLELSPARFTQFIHQSPYADLSRTCAQYYVEGQRLKMNIAGRVCNDFTQDLYKRAVQQEVAGEGVHLLVQDLRDPVLWKRWLRHIGFKLPAEKK